jgi:3-oxoacyl-[acyl-carrier-protein] synthase-3
MSAVISAIEYELPAGVLTNADLCEDFPDWAPEKIAEKTGIETRHIVADDETAADLAVRAAQKLFARRAIDPATIDFIILCTQSPDYFLPTSACLIQARLGIPTTAGAFDFNLGCSGFVYGLGLCKGLIETGQASRVLLLTADTYSKFMNRRDRSVRTIFGDAAAATLVEAQETPEAIGPFDYGTDGRGAENLIVRTGGLRALKRGGGEEECDDAGNWRSTDDLFMNGPEIFNFTLKSVPRTVQALLEKAGRSIDDVDAFVFHQANRYMLEHLRKKLKLDVAKFVIEMEHCGNTVSSTIPIALVHAVEHGQVRPGQLVMLVGFGVGYSWASCLIRWMPERQSR